MSSFGSAIVARLAVDLILSPGTADGGEGGRPLPWLVDQHGASVAPRLLESARAGRSTNGTEPHTAACVAAQFLTREAMMPRRWS
jgi:hypothetical protein